MSTLWQSLNIGKYLIIRITKELLQGHRYLLLHFVYTEWRCGNHRIFCARYSSTAANILSTGRCRGWLGGGRIGSQWGWLITSPGRVITWRWSRRTAPRLPAISWNILHLISELSQTYSCHSKVSTGAHTKGDSTRRFSFNLSLFPFYNTANGDDYCRHVPHQ